MTTTLEKPFSVGKYLVSPFTKITEGGDYQASLSIRSGRGTATHDRVFRFLPRFATSQAALDYAALQGRQLMRQPLSA